MVCIKVLVAESLDKATLDLLAKEHVFSLYGSDVDPQTIDQEGVHVFYQPSIEIDALASTSHLFQAIIVRPKEVTTEVVENGKDSLKLIIRGGTGVNSIAVKTASQYGIVVENTPGQNAVATAEFTFLLMAKLMTHRNIRKSQRDTFEDSCLSPEFYLGNELAGKSIGIIGLGNIGNAVARRCAAFDMQVHVYNRTLRQTPYITHESLESLLEAGPNVISLHVPLVLETEHIFNESLFAKICPDTVLINCARPQLIELEAFKNALDAGIISSYGIDGDYELVEPFVQCDPKQRGIITHHIADATHEAQANITRQVFIQMLAFFREGKQINVVNPEFAI